MNYCAIIPSYNPDEKLEKVVNGLKAKGFDKIIVVDDGSKSRERFDALDGCIVLHHAVNLGKGRGLKTAINYYLTHLADECIGIVTADGDNQHSPDDILNCCNAISENPNTLILGVREFSGENVPRRSRMGNRITSFVFKAFCGITISDTQTGLRAMDNETAKKFLDTFGERFEYETNMLLETKSKEIPIKEIPIKTIYIEENQTSHFNTITDSIAIYKLIFKFASSSVISLLIDLGLFTLFTYIFAFLGAEAQILLATVIARIVSSMVNFLANKNLVFKNKSGMASCAVRYYLLAAVQMMISFAGVYGLGLILPLYPTLIKVVVDLVLFSASFVIQREWVFRGNKKVK